MDIVFPIEIQDLRRASSVHTIFVKWFTSIKDIKDQRLVSIKTSDSYRSKISENPYKAKINYKLPFRVKFINVGIPGYGPGSTAPIGIAIIGLNNYIL